MRAGESTPAPHRSLAIDLWSLVIGHCDLKVQRRDERADSVPHDLNANAD
jgi:hypothetical protein